MSELNTYQKAINYLKANDYTLAIVSFTEALEQGYSDRNLHYYLAICYANLNYHNEALEEIELAFKEDLEFSVKLQLLHLKGYILFLQNKNEEALKVFEEALEYDAHNQITISSIGYYYYKSGVYDKALKYYEKAYKMTPDAAKTMNNYGYMLTLTQKDIKRGLELCENALKKNPNSAAILDSCGWANFLLNKITNATAFITKAVKLDKNNISEIKEHYSKIAAKVREIISKDKEKK